MMKNKKEVLPSSSDENQPGELRETLENNGTWLMLNSIVKPEATDPSLCGYFHKNETQVIIDIVNKAIRSQAEGKPSEGSETTGEVQENPVLDFSASPLNNQLERPAEVQQATLDPDEYWFNQGWDGAKNKQYFTFLQIVIGFMLLINLVLCCVLLMR